MRDTIVLGASLGGVEALCEIVARLPQRLPATILAVLHVGPHRSALPSLLSAAGPLPARHARDGEMLEQGVIYVAPPNHHLAIAHDRARVFRGPKVHFARPAIDPLFRSAAVSRGSRVIAAVLTGLLDDGSAGLQAVRACGGVTIAQDPATATAAEMPENAIRAGKPHYVLPLGAIGAKLAELVGTPHALCAAASETLICEDGAARKRTLSIGRAAYHMDLGEVSEADRGRSRAARAAEAATLLEQFLREEEPDAT